MAKFLYVGEVGYGNLGDDLPAKLLQERLGEVEVRAFRDINAGQEPPKYLLVGGGTILDLANSHWMQTLVERAEKARGTAILGSGLDPGQPWTARGMELMNILMATTAQRHRRVRGPISRELLKLAGSLECSIGLDPLGLLDVPQIAGNGKVVFVPGHQARTAADSHFHDVMFGVARAMLDAQWELAISPVWIRDLDLALMYAHEFTRGKLASRSFEVEDILEGWKGAHALVANRMHAGLLALMAGIPAFFVGHHVKVMDMCLALDWPWYESAGSSALANRIQDMCLEAPDPPTERLKGMRKELREQVEDLAGWT